MLAIRRKRSSATCSQNVVGGDADRFQNLIEDLSGLGPATSWDHFPWLGVEVLRRVILRLLDQPPT